MKKLLFLLACTFIAPARSFAGDFYKCEGVIQNKPCSLESGIGEDGGKADEPWMRDVAPHKEGDKTLSDTTGPKSENGNQEDLSHQETNDKTKERAAPEIESHSQKLNTLEWEFYGTIKGQGVVDLKLYFLIDNGSRKVLRQFAGSTRVHLANKEDAKGKFSIRARPPVSPIWRWEVVGENK